MRALCKLVAALVLAFANAYALFALAKWDILWLADASLSDRGVFIYCSLLSIIAAIALVNTIDGRE